MKTASTAKVSASYIVLCQIVVVMKININVSVISVRDLCTYECWCCGLHVMSCCRSSVTHTVLWLVQSSLNTVLWLVKSLFTMIVRSVQDPGGGASSHLSVSQQQQQILRTGESYVSWCLHTIMFIVLHVCCSQLCRSPCLNHISINQNASFLFCFSCWSDGDGWRSEVGHTR